MPNPAPIPVAMPNPAPIPAVEALRMLKEDLDMFIEDPKEDVEMDEDDLKQIQKALSIKQCCEETYLICVAVSTTGRNLLSKIRCHRGTPLGGYAYDNVNESYCIECVEHINIGFIPATFQVSLGNWCAYIPMPENVLERHMSSEQKEVLQAFKSHFRGKKVVFEFLQLLS